MNRISDEQKRSHMRGILEFLISKSNTPMCEKFIDEYINVLEPADIINNPHINWEYLQISLDKIISRYDKRRKIIILNEVIKNPELYDFEYVSECSSISIHDIINNPKLPWYWPKVCVRRDLTFEIVKQNPNLPWISDILYEVLRLPIKYCQECFAESGCCGTNRTSNILEQTSNNSSQKFDKTVETKDNARTNYGRGININSHHCNLLNDSLAEIRGVFKRTHLSDFYLLRNMFLRLDTLINIFTGASKFWSIPYHDETLTIETIKKYTKIISVYDVFYHPAITIELIMDPKFPWNDSIQKPPKKIRKYEQIRDNRVYCWIKLFSEKARCISVDYVKKHKNFPFDWNNIWANIYIDIPNFIQNFRQYINWDTLSRNRVLTRSIVEKYFFSLNYDILIENEYAYGLTSYDYPIQMKLKARQKKIYELISGFDQFRSIVMNYIDLN